MGKPDQANYWLDQHRKLGDTTEGMQSSLRHAKPLAAIPQRLQGQFMQSLPPARRQELEQARRWYARTYLGR